jgi:pilus assembly protein CpaB
MRAMLWRAGFAVAWFGVCVLIDGARAQLLVPAPSPPPALVETTKIAVAATDLPLATRLRPDQVKVIDWPTAGVPPGAFRTAAEVTDRILTMRLLEGEPIVQQHLASKDTSVGIYPGPIPANMRAIAVSVDQQAVEQVIAGYVHPDDRVDVIVTLRPSKPADSEPVSKVIVQNVKVLAVGKEHHAELRVPYVETIVTLLVTPEESEKIASAASEGHIAVLLRAIPDFADFVPIATSAAAR